MLAEQIVVTLMVTDALDTLGVSYAIGGSLSSALHGVMRATMDADLVAALRLEHARPLAKVQGQQLDRGYMHHMAAELGVSDLLERAFKEAG
jgi:hypothetical protein